MDALYLCSAAALFATAFGLAAGCASLARRTR